MSRFIVRAVQYDSGIGTKQMWEVWDNQDACPVAHFASNAKAWKEADRRNGELVNKSQQTYDWSFRKSAGLAD